MVVDTTCMQAGPADPRAGGLLGRLRLEIISTELRVDSHCRMQMNANVNSFVLNIY